MNKLTRLLQLMEGLLEKVGYLCIIFSTLLVFVAVIMRYIFGVSIAWVEELSKVAILAMVFLTAGMLALRDDHMKFTFVSNRFKGRFAEYMNLFSRGWMMRVRIYAIIVNDRQRRRDSFDCINGEASL